MHAFVTSSAHKYDMKSLLEECEAYLVTQLSLASTCIKILQAVGQPGATVRRTLPAEKCELLMQGVWVIPVGVTQQRTPCS